MGFRPFAQCMGQSHARSLDQEAGLRGNEVLTNTSPVQIYTGKVDRLRSQASEVAELELATVVDVSIIPWGNTEVECNDVCRLRYLQWYVVLTPALPKILRLVQTHLSNGVQKLGICCRTGEYCSRALAELVAELQAEDGKCVKVSHLEAAWNCNICPTSSDQRLADAFRTKWIEALAE